MDMGIQKKVAWFLVLVLAAGFGLSTFFSARRATEQLTEYGEASGHALREAALDEARGVFTSLEVGTGGSLQRGEMELFTDLLARLGAIPEVLEVGLTDPLGEIRYSSLSETSGGRIGGAAELAAAAGEGLREEETGESLLLLRASRFTEECLECHEESRPGEAAGVLYVRYSLESLGQAKEELDALLSAGRRESLLSGAVTGLAGLLIASVGAYFLLGYLVRRPLEELEKMIGAMEKGRLGRRLGMKRKDEIGRMARTMDRFADSLETEVAASLRKLADGDLSFTVSPRGEDDALRNSLQLLREELSDILGEVRRTGEQIASGSVQVSDSSQSLSQGATESAASLEEISASMNVLASQTKVNAENASQASLLSDNAKAVAERGNNRMAAMVEAMGEIDRAGQSISKIIKVIDEIAFQTNLLALNAAVEAARAGAHGKGFAVVAEEVRSLAGRSAEAARETAELIEGTVKKTEGGTRIAGETAEALGEIVVGVTKVSDLLAEIAAASNEQAQGIGQVNQGLGQIDQVTQQNTANAEQSAAAAEQLSGQASLLRRMLLRFRLEGSAGAFPERGDEARALLGEK